MSDITASIRKLGKIWSNEKIVIERKHRALDSEVARTMAELQRVQTFVDNHLGRNGIITRTSTNIRAQIRNLPRPSPIRPDPSYNQTIIVLNNQLNAIEHARQLLINVRTQLENMETNPHGELAQARTFLGEAQTTLTHMNTEFKKLVDEADALMPSVGVSDDMFKEDKGAVQHIKEFLDERSRDKETITEDFATATMQVSLAHQHIERLAGEARAIVAPVQARAAGP